MLGIGSAPDCSGAIRKQSTHSARNEHKPKNERPSCSPGVGHPIRGTHKKMNGNDEQELCEFVRLKHHSHGLKNQQLG
jgi:hypothetical protein